MLTLYIAVHSNNCTNNRLTIYVILRSIIIGEIMNMGFLTTGAKLMRLFRLKGHRLGNYVMDYQWETCMLNGRGIFVQEQVVNKSHMGKPLLSVSSLHTSALLMSVGPLFRWAWVP